MNNLILYQTFLNGRRRTIYIFAIVCLFIALPFTWSALICLKTLLSISISKVFVICWNTSLLADFFTANHSKETSKLFSRSARTSANNSSSFSVHRVAFFLVLPFLSAIITCSNLPNHFL